MCTTIITLTQCPFCQENGEVYFDSRAATEQNLAKLHADDPDAGLASGILVYNSNRRIAGPCEHTVHITGCATTSWLDSAKKPGSLRVCEFDWISPTVVELDPRPGVWDLLSILIECAMPEQDCPKREHYENDKLLPAKYRPKTSCHECDFNESWDDFTTESSPRSLHVHGSIVFAQNVSRLFAELKRINERIALNAAADGLK